MNVLRCLGNLIDWQCIFIIQGDSKLLSGIPWPIIFKTLHLTVIVFLDIWHRPEIGSSSIDWDKLSRCHLKTETESNVRNVVF
jgi:hypothetical protein